MDGINLAEDRLIGSVLCCVSVTEIMALFIQPYAHFCVVWSRMEIYYILILEVLILPGIVAISLCFNATTVRFDILHLTPILIGFPLLIPP